MKFEAKQKLKIGWRREGKECREASCAVCVHLSIQDTVALFSSPVSEPSITKESISYDKSRFNQMTLCEQFFLQFKHL